ncbi:MAG: MraY family glycosyltransferase [Chloroflexota bacterium]
MHAAFAAFDGLMRPPILHSPLVVAAVPAPVAARPAWWIVLLALAVPALLASLLTPLVMRLALRFNIVDKPGGRKIHTRPVPMLGGLAICGAVMLSLPIVAVMTDSGAAGSDVPRELLALAAGGLVAVAVGLIDELIDLPPLLHFGGQLAAAVVALLFLHGTAMLAPLMLIGAGPNAVSRLAMLNPLFALLHIHLTSAQILSADNAHQHCGAACGTLTTLTIAFVVVWIVGMMNTINFLDGIDGMAAGVVAIAAGVLALLAWAPIPGPFVQHESADAILLPLIVAGAALGFLPFNWHPARIFMADTGAQFLGFALGLVALVGGAKLGTALIVLGVPILDVAWAIVRRRGSFGRSDRRHLHHRLLDLGLGHRRIVALYYTPALIFGISSVILHDIRHKIVLLLLLIVLAIISIARLAAENQRRTTGAGHA